MSAKTTIAAVLIAGAAAGFTVSPVILVATLILVVLLANGLYRADDPSLTTGDWTAFSANVAQQIDSCLSLMTEGTARRALLDVAVSARPLLESASSLLDRARERATRDRVERLVEVSCVTAVELDRIDEALLGDFKIEDAARDRLAATRRVLLLRLTNAAASLKELYVAGLTNTSAASERVAELTSELNADASARRAALAELAQLLDASSKN